MKFSRPIAFGAAMAVAAGILWWLGAAPPQQRAPSKTQERYNNAAARAEAKFQHIQENGERERPDQTPTVFSELEINSYLNSGKVKLPTGVQRVQFAGRPETIEATATVDFDAITASRRSSNPLLSLFRGVHDVHATARADGSGSEGHVHIRSLDIDGVGVPRMALEFFVDRYVTPKYPGVGLDSTFKLPARIDIVKIGDQKMTVTQK
jgi:hypothetical protein